MEVDGAGQFLWGVIAISPVMESVVLRCVHLWKSI